MDGTSHPRSSSQHHDQHLQPNAHQSANGSPIAKRKPGRPIEETDNRELELKREKARERQRRKRARDKIIILQKAGELVAAVSMDEDPQPHDLVPASSQPSIVPQIPIQSSSQPAAPPPPPPHHPPQPQPIPMPMQVQEPAPPPPQSLPLPPSINMPDGQSTASHINDNPSAAGPSSLLVPTPEDPRPLSQEDLKREKIRRAARERQRKHRALLKAKRMTAIDISQIAPPPGYSHAHPQHAHHPAGHGPPHPHLLLAQEQILFQDQVAAAALQAQAAQAQILAEVGAGVPTNQMMPAPPQAQSSHPPAQNPSSAASGGAMPPAQPVPPGAPSTNGSPGEAFASYMMLALSCAPMLKAHVITSMGMTEADLHAVQQLIGSAWDQWNHMRHHPGHQQQANNAPAQGSSEQVSFAEGSAPSAPAGQGPVEYFRERFQRTMAQPSPYQNQAGGSAHSSSPSPKRSRRARGGRPEPITGRLIPISDGRADAVGESDVEDEEMRDINQTYSSMDHSR